MAKFFNQKVKKSNSIATSTIVIGAIVGVLIVISIGVVISVKGGNSHSDAVIELGDGVAVEVNSKLPDKTLFFAELENVKENDIKANFDKVNIKKVGSYGVTISVYGKKYESKVNVVDTEAPVLTTKDVNIALGETYKSDDFVDSCKDNSKEDCIIKFYGLGLNQDGEKIDYSSYKEEGSYTIQITASDSSGNTTSPMSATLVIGKKSNNTGNAGNTNKPSSCKYGNTDYDTSKYILAVNVSDNDCALDLNMYQDNNIVAPVNALIASEETKLKKEFSKINLNTKDIYLNSEIGPVLNNTGNGIVGYTLLIQVSIPNSKGDKEIIEEYYVKADGSRQYSINKYL